MQNFDKGKFNFRQIQFAVTTLKKMNENPLGAWREFGCIPDEFSFLHAD